MLNLKEFLLSQVLIGLNPENLLSGICQISCNLIKPMLNYLFAQCNTEHDRDINAVINLRNMAVNSAASACGEDGPALGVQDHVETSLYEAGI